MRKFRVRVIRRRESNKEKSVLKAESDSMSLENKIRLKRNDAY